jgi:NO-binding membrane sensor protein with MHYT domain
MNGMPGSFNYFMVLLSYVISVCGAYTALVLARESTKVEPHERLPWVAWSAVTMGGIGIWSMHFVGMMAYDMNMPVSYDIGKTTLSLSVGIISTGIGFAIVGLGSRALWAIALAGVFMGSGVAAMHYMGMAAMRMAANIEYNMPLVWVSIAIAVVASSVALWMAFCLTARWQMIVSAIVAGVAVCGMHYTGMVAITMTHDASAMDSLPSALSPLVMGSGLFILSLLVLAVGLALTRQRVVTQQPSRQPSMA